MNKICLLLAFLTYSSLGLSQDKIIYDKELTNLEYPFEVKTFEFESQRQALNMRYMDIGDSLDKKKVALLLHGKNFSGSYWSRIAIELVNKGYRVVIPDQVGFGKSTKPEYYDYSFAQLGLNTISLLTHLSIKRDVVIVGHSMGGMLATHLSYMKPSLFKQLVLINPIGLEKYSDYVQIKDPQFFYEKELKKTEAGVRNYQKKNYYDGKWTDEYEKLINIHIGWLNGPDKALIAWNNALTYMPIFTEDIVSKVKDLKVPTVLIIGTRDTTGPGRGWKKPGVDYKLGQYQKLGKSFIQGFKNTDAKLLELEGLGHLPQFENYGVFSKVFYPLFD